MARATTVEALAPGDHACLTFSDQDERLDLVAAFVRDGLRGSARVMCLTESIAPDEFSAELVDRGVPAGEAVPRGQLMIFSSEESWLANGDLSGLRMVDMIARHIDEAQRLGYGGLRLTADMCWVNRPIAAADQLPVFEEQVDKLFADGRLTAICQYDRELFDAVTLSFAANAHAHTVAAAVYVEDPVLRICRQHSLAGVRLAGEIDYRHVDALQLALNEALSLDHDVHVNLAKLHFIDAAAASTIMQAAVSLPSNRTMTVTCGDPVLRTLRLVGAADVLRLVRTHDES
jgi:anti-anti-sigma factor